MKTLLYVAIASVTFSSTAFADNNNMKHIPIPCIDGLHSGKAFYNEKAFELCKQEKVMLHVDAKYDFVELENKKSMDAHLPKIAACTDMFNELVYKMCMGKFNAPPSADTEIIIKTQDGKEMRPIPYPNKFVLMHKTPESE